MEKIYAILGAIVIVLGITVLLAWPLQLLWNSCLVSAVEGIHPIGFWQALGINILTSILFKGTEANVKS